MTVNSKPAGCTPRDAARGLWDDLRELLQQVPFGQVTTYGDLAEALGDIAAARWIGGWLLDHEHDESCICHRVVKRTGEIGLHVSRSEGTKSALLRGEGIEVTDDRTDLDRFRFREFESSQPLKELRAIQNALPSRFVEEPLAELPAIVAGVDVSYRSDISVSAVAVVEVASGELVDSATCEMPVPFPYIPGYLSFRELPALLGAIAALGEKRPMPEVVFVDGNGILHPRGAGIATHLGIETGLRTIGVGKNLLCGKVAKLPFEVNEAPPIVFDDRTIGAAVKAGERSRPIYISPGHRMTVDAAVAFTRALFHGHRLPEPIYFADRLSRDAANG